MTLSVVVETKNDRRFVRDCLDTLRAQDVPIDELVVLDLGSTDGTTEVARACGATTVVMAGRRAQDVARGGTVCVAQVRARYAPDALRHCLEGGGTAARWVGTTNFGRAVAAMQRWLPPDAPLLTAWSIDRPGDLRTNGDGWRFVPETPGALAAWCFGRTRRRARAGLIIAAAAGAVGGRGWRRAAVPLAHAAVCAALALRAGREPGVAPHRAFVAAEVGHWAAAAGALRP